MKKRKMEGDRGKESERSDEVWERGRGHIG